MNILLTGAGGFIGQAILRALVTQGHHVYICSTKQQHLQQRYPKIRCLPLQYSAAQSADDWLPYLQNIDVVINSVGIIREDHPEQFTELHAVVPIALFKACEQARCQRLIQISALGAGDDASTQYFVSKGRADAYLATLDLDWFVLRPSLVIGAAGQSFFLFKALAALPLLLLLGDGRQQLQPVQIEDLVAAVLICVNGQTKPHQMLDVVGAESLSFADMLQSIRCWFGKAPAPTLSIPNPLLKHCAPFGRWLQEPAFTPEAMRMLQQGNCAEVEPFAQVIGYQPKNFKAILQDVAPTQAERWHAQLYFLRPLLRVSLALVWVWAGWVSLLVYPHQQSYEMLAQVGIDPVFAPWVLIATSVMDVVLGCALFLGWRLRLVIICQLLAMLIYSLVISMALPEFWAHPFGPMIKNVPIVIASLVLIVLEEDSI